jgi:hypothetical protein
VPSASAAYDGDSSRIGAARHPATGFLTEVRAVPGLPVSAAPSTCTPLLPWQVTQILDRRPFLVVYLVLRLLRPAGGDVGPDAFDRSGQSAAAPARQDGADRRRTRGCRSTGSGREEMSSSRAVQTIRARTAVRPVRAAATARRKVQGIGSPLTLSLGTA